MVSKTNSKLSIVFFFVSVAYICGIYILVSCVRSDSGKFL